MLRAGLRGSESTLRGYVTLVQARWLEQPGLQATRLPASPPQRAPTTGRDETVHTPAHGAVHPDFCGGAWRAVWR